MITVEDIFREHCDLLANAWLEACVPANVEMIDRVVTVLARRLDLPAQEWPRLRPIVAKAWDDAYHGNLRRYRRNCHRDPLAAPVRGKMYKVGDSLYRTRAGASSARRAWLRRTGLSVYQGRVSAPWAPEIEPVLIRG